MAGFGDEFLLVRPSNGAVDLSNNQHPVVGTPNPTIVTSDGLPAFDFGVGKDNVSFGPIWDHSGPVTMAFWSKSSNLSQQRGIGGQSLEGPGRLSCHAPFSDNNIYFDYGGISRGRIAADYTAFVDQWTLVVLRSTGDENTSQSINLNGVQVATRAGSEFPRGATEVTISGANLNSAFFQHDGLIDDYRLFQRILTDQEIAEWYAGGRSFDLTGPLSTNVFRNPVFDNPTFRGSTLR